MSLRIAFDLDGTLADMQPALEAIARRLFPLTELAAAVERAAALERAPAPASTDGLPPAAPAPADDEPAAPSGDPQPADAQPGDDLTPEEERLEPPSVRMLSRRQQHMVWDEVRHTENFWESLAETEPGIVARIAAMAEERRWEVLFITTRPGSAGRTTQRQSQRWLAAHGFPLPSVFVSPGSRGKIASALALDLVVDDRADNCLDVKLDSPARAVLVARDATPQASANAARLGIEVVPSVGALLDELAAAPARPSLLSRLRRAVTRNG